MGDASWKTCGTSVRRTLKRFFDKTLENLSSLKFYGIAVASFLLWKNKLDSEYWFYAITVCIASRGTIEIATVIKDIMGFKHGIGTPTTPTPAGKSADES